VSRANDFVNLVPAEHAPNGYPQHGLTIREHFAAMAMQGICGDGIPGSHHQPAATADDAVAMADALLAALAKVRP
jgi:hypothetical protein